MKGIGWALIIVGFGSIVLPATGYQFVLMAPFGDKAWIFGIVVGLLGVVAVYADHKRAQDERRR